MLDRLFSRKWKYEHPEVFPEHKWTKGSKTVRVYWMNGSGNHSGYVVKAKDSTEDVTHVLSNGFIHSLKQALILADMYMDPEKQDPACYMHSDKIEGEDTFGGSVLQEEWLDAHEDDYEFTVTKTEKVKEY